jgi:hypothetical protein
MINFVIWALAIIVTSVFSLIFIGGLYAAIYDWWYQRKYATWIALQDQSTDRINKIGVK